VFILSVGLYVGKESLGLVCECRVMGEEWLGFVCELGLWSGSRSVSFRVNVRVSLEVEEKLKK